MNLIISIPFSRFITLGAISKTLLIFALIAHSFAVTHNYIINTNKLPLYEINFQYLLLFSITHSNKNFLNHTCNYLIFAPLNYVNNIFLDFLHNYFLIFILIFTDGFVSPLSTGCLFQIPEFHISFSNNLPPTTLSFTAECFVIIEVLNTISSLSPNKFLVATDSLSYHQPQTHPTQFYKKRNYEMLYFHKYQVHHEITPNIIIKRFTTGYSKLFIRCLIQTSAHWSVVVSVE